MSIFSGHDTVIAPVLAALGVYHGSLCRWPSYAAHVVFELWQPKHGQEVVKGRGEQQQRVSGDGGATRTASENAADNNSKYYLRVLYNGVDITQRVPTCSAERNDLNRRHTRGETLSKVETSLLRHDNPLCSMAALHRQIDGLISPHDSIQEACQVE